MWLAGLIPITFRRESADPQLESGPTTRPAGGATRSDSATGAAGVGPFLEARPPRMPREGRPQCSPGPCATPWVEDRAPSSERHSTLRDRPSPEALSALMPGPRGRERAGGCCTHQLQVSCLRQPPETTVAGPLSRSALPALTLASGLLEPLEFAGDLTR